MLVMLLLKGLLAAIIVGFVTASIQSWVDRFFLVILLVTLIGLPIQEAITINLIVVSLSALMLALRQSEILRSVREEWPVVALPAIVGAIAGRVSGLWLPPQVLTILLGIYAILAGLRLAFIRPIPAKENSMHSVWIAPSTFMAGAVDRPAFCRRQGLPGAAAQYGLGTPSEKGIRAGCTRCERRCTGCPGGADWPGSILAARPGSPGALPVRFDRWCGADRPAFLELETDPMGELDRRAHSGIGGRPLRGRNSRLKESQIL